MEQIRTLRIIVASPGDVMAERDALPAVLEELNHGIAADRNLRLELIRWETDAYPGFHPEGPQGLIDTVLQIADCDILIGIFWKRFGSPTMGVSSGTEHEIRTAYEACRQNGRPHIMVYFNKKPYTPGSKEETDQWGQVLEFQRQFPKEVMWWNYNGKTQFEKLARQHLTKVIRRLAPSSNTLGVAPDSSLSSLNRVTGALKSLGGLTGKLRPIAVQQSAAVPVPVPHSPQQAIIDFATKKKWMLLAIAALMILSGVAAGYFMMLTPRERPLKTETLLDKFDDLNRWVLPENRSGWNTTAKKRLELTNSKLGYIKVEDCWYQDFELQFKLWLDNGLGAEWAVRVQDKDHYYLFRLEGPERDPQKLSYIYAYAVNDSNERQLQGRVTVTLKLKAAGDGYTVFTRVRGYAFEILMRDDTDPSVEQPLNPPGQGEVPIATFRDDDAKAFRAGSVGLRAGIGNEKFTVDNFRVEPK